MKQDADVLIVGAGPAGLTLACALADAGLAVRVLEQQPLAVIEQPAEDGRDIALTHRARRVMERLGLWNHLAAGDVSALNLAKVMDGSSPLVLEFEREGGGNAGPLGWTVPNHRIRAAALAASRERQGIELLCDSTVTALQRDASLATLTLSDGRRCSAPLVVAADSRFSATRRMAGIGAAMHDFGRSVVVGRVQHERSHDGAAWECFRYGNTLALLPLEDNRFSAVVTLASDKAPEWLALPDAEFAARVQAQTDGRFGNMQAAGPRHHYPLVAVYAQRFVRERLALIGDAAVGMHPVTAHGWNFGLYGVEVLARELAASRRAGKDLGAIGPLQIYEREHRRTTLPIWLGTNAVVTLFTDERRVPKLARRAVLAVSARLPLLSNLVKGSITRQLTGLPAL